MQLSVIVFGLSLLLADCAFASDDNVTKVNGSIRIDANAVTGSLTTVNGSIHIGDHAHAKSAETVNGGIHIGTEVEIGSVETVNGGIVLAEKTRVSGTVEAVNGSITLAPGTDVAGRVSNVNGGIKLANTHVGGGIETVSGDVTIGANARVEGGLLVDTSHSNSWFQWGVEKKPRVVIGPHAVVDGTLMFKREVELFVSDSATVGKVEGATAIKFSGDAPPG